MSVWMRGLTRRKNSRTEMEQGKREARILGLEDGRKARVRNPRPDKDVARLVEVDNPFLNGIHC